MPAAGTVTGTGAATRTRTRIGTLPSFRRVVVYVMAPGIALPLTVISSSPSTTFGFLSFGTPSTPTLSCTSP